MRTEATGYGLIYILDVDAEEKRQGAGRKDGDRVRSAMWQIYATQKAQQLGAKVVALSDSNGYVYDKDGIKLDVVKEIKEVRRGRIKEYVDAVPQPYTRRAKESGPSPAISHFPALPRTSWIWRTPRL